MQCGRNVHRQALFEFCARHAGCTHSQKVVAFGLTVNQLETPTLKIVAEIGQCDFGGIVPAREHGLTKKYLTEGDPVQSSDQHIVVPDLDRMGDLMRVQQAIGRLHLGRNPSALAPHTRAGAGIEHLGEGLIAGHPKRRAPQRALE